MHIEVIIIVSSVLLYTCKCYRLNECKKRFENNNFSSFNYFMKDLSFIFFSSAFIVKYLSGLISINFSHNLL